MDRGLASGVPGAFGRLIIPEDDYDRAGERVPSVGSSSRPVPAAPASNASPVREGRTDDHGVYHQSAPVSAGVVGFYLFLVLLLVYVSTRGSFSNFPFLTEILVAVFALFLARNVATRYRLDSDELVAWRIFGNRRVRFETIRKIELSNLRDLGPVGMFGSWGWRGRMWSPVIGSFDAIQTASAGVLVTAGAHPLFISPKDPVEFARELSRRARSYTGPLEVDAGNPAAAPPTPSGF